MKKSAFIVFIILLGVIKIYAIDLSLSAQLGAGSPVMRSSYATVQKAVAMQNGDYGIKSYKPAIFNIQGQGIMLLEFTPNLGMEIGLGLRYSQHRTAHEQGSNLNLVKFQRLEVTFPLYFRAQYRYAFDFDLFDNLTTYATIGPKVSLPFLYDYREDIYGNLFQTPANSVNLDISFSLGHDIEIEQDVFVGLRFGYDLNIIDTISDSVAQGDADQKETFIDNYGHSFHDDFTVYISYRKMM